MLNKILNQSINQNSQFIFKMVFLNLHICRFICLSLQIMQQRTFTWQCIAMSCMLLTLVVLLQTNVLRIDEVASFSSGKTSTCNKSAMLAVDTMLYVKFGESLNKSRNFTNDDEYMQYVRTSIAKPSTRIPRSTRPLSEQWQVSIEQY